MIAVLINTADVRLGHTRMPDACRLIQFGGAYFVRTTDTAVMPEGGELGVVFVAAEIYVESALDVFEPTRNFSKRPTGRNP
jgi:hypothetical protein